jgi:hypothetical protein
VGESEKAAYVIDLGWLDHDAGNLGTGGVGHRVANKPTPAHCLSDGAMQDHVSVSHS